MLYEGKDSIIHKRREAGKIGGSRKVPKGYSFNKELASDSGKTGGKWSRLTEAQVDEVFRVRNSGLTLMEISTITGVSYGTVQKLCKLWKETGV